MNRASLKFLRVVLLDNLTEIDILSILKSGKIVWHLDCCAYVWLITVVSASKLT